MCNKRNSSYQQLYHPIGNNKADLGDKTRLDFCIKNLIYVLNNYGIKTIGCCCGHGKYNISIIYRSPNNKVWDLVSGIEIHRKKRFYLKDKEGYYYIPEVQNALLYTDKNIKLSSIGRSNKPSFSRTKKEAKQ